MYILKTFNSCPNDFHQKQLTVQKMTVRNVKIIAVKLMVTTHNSILIDHTIEDANADKNNIRFQY